MFNAVKSLLGPEDVQEAPHVEFIGPSDGSLSSVESDYTLEEDVLKNRFDTLIDAYLSNIPSLYDLYDTLSYEECRKISKRDREQPDFSSTTLSYAEITFEDFGVFLLSLFKNYDLDTKGDQLSFIDLGCGSGKAVFSAYITNIFIKCCGIEILSGFHKANHGVLHDYIKHYHDRNSLDAVNIHFYLGDATYYDWSHYDVVFAYASAFDNDMMNRLAVIANKMPKGGIFISISNKLPNEVTFECILTTKLKVHSGQVTAYVYKRNAMSVPGVPSVRARLDEILKSVANFGSISTKTD